CTGAPARAMPQAILLLLTILVHAGAGFPTDGARREKHASWDDVNVVAHGLLQLGQGLKEHVDKTKVQMRDISSKLKAFNGTVAELERRTDASISWWRKSDNASNKFTTL
uniref:Uncharacterized protein n=1 Tax=Fundulus heteroclitus TaxID=8078 RepID=A0A3Q2QT52_FUNHE